MLAQALLAPSVTRRSATFGVGGGMNRTPRHGPRGAARGTAGVRSWRRLWASH